MALFKRGKIKKDTDVETQRGRVGKKGISRQEGGEQEAESETDGRGENLNTCLDGAEVIFLRKICLRPDLKENIPPQIFFQLNIIHV